MGQELKPNQIIRNSRRYTDFNVQTRSVDIEGSDNKEMYVEGLPVVFNTPTVLFEYGGIEYREQIDPHAFDECKMDDVIFNYNHAGKVIARTRNKTLQLWLEEDGLHMRARLDGTQEGIALYQEISGGYIDRMSFCWTEPEDGTEYNEIDHLWTVKKCKRLYDVSAVSIPAYDDTSIEARKNFILEADAQNKRERQAAAELFKQKLKLKLILT